MKALATALVLLFGGCSTGPYSLDAQLSRRLGNIGKHLDPASLARTVSRRVSNLARTSGRMVQVQSRLEQMGAGTAGAVVGEWDRTVGLPDSVGSFVGTGVDRFESAVRKFGDPPPPWEEHLSLARITGRFWGAISSLGTVLGLDRRVLPMPGDPERLTDPQRPPGQTPNLWDRILYRLRL